jgi:hypothetical protein
MLKIPSVTENLSLSLSHKICLATYIKVKCTLVQALRLCTGRTAHRGSRGIALLYRHWVSVQAVRPIRGSRGIALLFHDHGTRRGWGVSVTLQPLFIPGKDPVPIVQEAGWAPGPIWTGAENLAPTGIRSPESPARSQSLYRLSYPAHSQHMLAHYLTFFLGNTDRTRYVEIIFLVQ